MPPKAKARGHQSHQPQPQPSDYETDAANVDLPVPPPRSNSELNLSAIRRHYPDVTSIQHVASYAVLYTFSLSSQAWEKIGIEGSLFVCTLTPSLIGADRFGVVILNRRGLENWRLELASEEELEITEEYIIVQGDDDATAAAETDGHSGGEGEAEAEGGSSVYGIWIFAEPEPSSTARARVETAAILQSLAKQARESRESKQRDIVVGNGAGTQEAIQVDGQVEESVPMGRQLSLRELFGQQREQDAAWSVHNHGGQNQGPSQAQHPAAGGGGDMLAQLFLKAKQDYNGVG
ncbi:PH domain-like protein [Lophiostoma macrostomum CBS 122681]|uniref:PH domain-like protein n=1 Tax=Lophiostoma macrostomum CBS 122681 TaxID=1314788 RepID=A0A6A6T591_9PLEO|nr:PH domain-like protein [Lophiostoma macrostomum CBS 122681]